MPPIDRQSFVELTARAELIGARIAANGDVSAAIDFAVELGETVPKPGKGQTLRRWRTLSAVAAGDLTVARILEPHLDALAILEEAGHSPTDGGWGVFAASRPDLRLRATEVAAGAFELAGIKAWCSLGEVLEYALITADGPDTSRLFAVALGHAGIGTGPAEQWVARGLRAVPSVALRFDQVPAVAVGAPGWYLSRPGFAWGAVGVAACWYGGAASLVEALRTTISSDADRNHSGLAHLALGRADLALYSARLALQASAESIDSGQADAAPGRLLAQRVRSLVAAAAEEVLSVVGRALGPAPLALDEAHSRRVADLLLYLRQHHGERDVADLGRQVLDSADPW